MVCHAMLRLQDAEPNACQGRLAGSSGDTFQLKGAEWADVKSGSHDAAVRAQARERPKYSAIAAARASTSPRRRTSSWQTVLVSEAAQPDSHPVCNLACGCAGK